MRLFGTMGLCSISKLPSTSSAKPQPSLPYAMYEVPFAWWLRTPTVVLVFVKTVRTALISSCPPIHPLQSMELSAWSLLATSAWSTHRKVFLSFRAPSLIPVFHFAALCRNSFLYTNSRASLGSFCVLPNPSLSISILIRNIIVVDVQGQ